MPNEPSTNTYETINYNMFKYGFSNPSTGEPYFNYNGTGSLPNNLSALNCLLIGENTLSNAGALNSIAIFGSVLGPRSISIGDGSVVFGSNSLALGDDAGTDSNNSLALGANANIIGADDAVQLGDGTNTTAETLQYLNVTLANSSGLVIPGPFADDTAASSGGVGIGNPYYTATGDMKVRLT